MSRRITVSLTEAQANGVLSLAEEASAGCEQDGPGDHGMTYAEWRAGERGLSAIRQAMIR